MRLKQPLLDDHPEEIVVTEEDATPEEAAKTLAAKRETLRLVVDHLLLRKFQRACGTISRQGPLQSYNFATTLQKFDFAKL